MKNNLYLIISEDKTIRDFNLHQVLKKIPHQEESKIFIDLTVSSVTDLLDEASMMSMFSQTKVIITESFNIDKLTDYELEYFNKYLHNPNKDSYLLLLTSKVDTRKKGYKLLKEYFTIIDDNDFNPNDVSEYVKKILKEKNYSMSDIDVFINKVGININNINLELNKLMLYKEQTKVITLEDINLLIKDNIDTVMYEFTNAFFDQDYNKLILMYDKFKKDNVSPDYLISSLAGSIKNSIIIKFLKSNGKTNLEISKIIGKKEFFVKKSLERLYRYTLDDLIDFQISLARIDSNLKSGKSNIDELVFFLLHKENN